MKTLLTLLPALVAAAACAGVRVSMDVRANGMHLADGTVDGVPCRLLVDTGATHTTFDLAFVTNRLPAARLEDVKVFGETNVGFAPKCFARAAFRLGGHAFPAQGAMAVPLDGLHASIGERIDGVLGMSDLATADFILRDREIEFAPDASVCASFGPDRRRGGDALNPQVAGRHAGREIAFLVDSGSSFTFVNTALWEATTNAVDLTATEISGRSGLAPHLGAAGELDLGVAFTLRPMVSARPVNYLGADFLKVGEILFRARGGAISFRRAGGPAPAGP